LNSNIFNYKAQVYNKAILEKPDKLININNHHILNTTSKNRNVKNFQ